MNEKRFIDEPVSLEERQLADGTKADYITGYGIVFDKWSKPLVMELKTGQRVQFVEKISPEAVKGVDMANTVSMVNHSITLGKRSKGTMDIDVDNYGVKYSVKVPNTTIGNDAKEDIRNGNLEGSSFQFAIPRGGDSWDKSVTPFQRTINKFSLITEMGPVTYPAYPDTTAAMRSLEEVEKEAEGRTEAEALEFEKRLKRLKMKYNYSKLHLRAMPAMEAKTLVVLCNECRYACENNIYICINLNYQKCLSLCRDCADICQLCALLCARNSKYLQAVISLCYQVCSDCYAECKKYDECQECAKACKACADACKSMMS